MNLRGIQGALVLIAILASGNDTARGDTQEAPVAGDLKRPVKEIQVGGVNGGESAYGCLGCIVSLTGTVIKVYPESDLNRFEVAPKDKITGINGHKFHAFQFQKECLGPPGSALDLEVKHKGLTRQIAVQRADSRTLSQYGHRYKRLAEGTRYW